MKVLMSPHASDMSDQNPSGIQQVVLSYFRHLPEYDVELVGKEAESYDLLAVHAGAPIYGNGPLFHHCHGLYWCADYHCTNAEFQTNVDVIDRMRRAEIVHVPSEWVATTVRRDMHIDPLVLGHGINFDEWEPGENMEYVLWNKNRGGVDACDPTPVNQLASLAPQQRFLTTFAADGPTPNMKVTGRVSHAEMKEMIRHAEIYLSTTKETWGLGTVEAMACGVPVLGFDFGGTADLVEHGVTGYLARPFDYEDLLIGLEYCKKYRKELGANARESAKQCTWGRVCEALQEQYALAIEKYQERFRPMQIDPALYLREASHA